MPNHKKILLEDGSELFVNKCGKSGWSVDIFPAVYPNGDPVLKGEILEPFYHAFHSTEEEALNDAASWNSEVTS